MAEITANDIGLVLAFELRGDVATQAAAGLGELVLSPVALDLTVAYREALREERESDLWRLEADAARAIIADNRARLADIRLRLLEAESDEERETLMTEAREIAVQARVLADELADAER